MTGAARRPSSGNRRVRGEVHAEGKVDVVREEWVQTVTRERTASRQGTTTSAPGPQRPPLAGCGSLLASRGMTGQYASTARTT